MKIKVAHHIFASRQGYETQFRSPDVSDSESGELERFSFGQTNDPSYMESLQENPAFTVRKLRSGRWAITRVFPGADDDYGRTTLLFHTVLVSQEDWAGYLDFDIKPFLFHRVLWENTQSADIVVEPDNSPLPQNVREQVAFLLNQITGSASPVIVEEAICSLEVVRWVHRRLLDDEKEEFSYGYRVLSDAMDAALLCLARQAVRTAAPARGRHATQTVSTAQSLTNEPSMERRSSPHTIAIICMLIVCIVGSAGAIYALLAFRNAQKEQVILETLQLATAFVDTNQNFTAELQERQAKAEEVDRLIEAIGIVLEGARSSGVRAESEKIIEKLNNWKHHTRIVGEWYTALNDLTERAVQEHLDRVAPPYPRQDKVISVRRINNTLTDFINLVVNESSLQFFTDIDVIHDALNLRKTISNWEKEIERLIVVDPNAVDVIKNIINETDPNQYTAVDPWGVNFVDPNLLNYVDPNADNWRNPKAFRDIAESDIAKLNHVDRMIIGLLADSSLRNAMNSDISAHKKLAVEYEAKVRCLQRSIEQNRMAIRKLISKAEEIKWIEDGFDRTDYKSVLRSFKTTLGKYEERRGTTCNCETIWLEHLKWSIVNFYCVNIRPHLDAEQKTYPYTDFAQVKDVYETVRRSSLRSEQVFESVYQHYERMAAQEARK